MNHRVGYCWECGKAIFEDDEYHLEIMQGIQRLFCKECYEEYKEILNK